MEKLSTIGRIFYGVGMAGMGFQTIYYKDFPYMLIPLKHAGIPGLAILACIAGALLMLAGLCIFFGIKPKQAALLLGSVLLMVFCFYFIPYQLIAASRYMHYGEWENAMKELALASGAFVIAGCFSAKNDTTLFKYLSKLIPLGAILFAITMISFGIDHFVYGKEAADYVPVWIPYHVFWIYFCGIPLLGSGIAIILKIKTRLIATLLGIMIFIWVVILHIPYAIANPFGGMGGEVTSAFLALAYSGIAFVIAGNYEMQGVQHKSHKTKKYFV